MNYIPDVSQNWDSFWVRCLVKDSAWWLYTLALFTSSVGTILTHEAIKALANHTAIALNHTRHAIALISDEVIQMRKVMLQNRMALDLLTAVQGAPVPLCTPSVAYISMIILTMYLKS